MEMQKLLELSVQERASDLHILPGLPPMMRVDGDLVPAKEYETLSPDRTKSLIYSIMSKEQQEKFEKNLEYDNSFSIDNVGHFRMNVLFQLHGVAAVFRIIPKNVPTFDELGLPPVLKSLAVLSNGLILVTGATGSGKSTTLAAMINYISALRPNHIITIEDPIEYVYDSKKSLINQRQVHRDTPDVTSALRAALRQDPNVILLGEMRDLETIRLALTAAETGHLVMATLHASSAPLSISRIIDAFPSEERDRVRNILAESLQAVIYQTLVKKNTGGRIGAYEIMLATPAIRHLIHSDKIPQMTMTIQTNGDLGMCTLDQYLEKLVAKNLVSPATARAAAVNKDWF